MSSEFYDEDAAVNELKARLRTIKDTVTPLIVNGMVDPAKVPKSIREEIVQIFDEHGGIDLLANLTKLTFNTIHCWHRRWTYNPYVYRTPCEIVRQRKSNTLIRKVLTPKEKPEKKTKSQQVITNESTEAQKIRSKITAEQEAMVKHIKEIMQQKLREGIGLDEEIQQEVKELYEELNDSRQIAILLGIDRGIVEEWVFDVDFE